MLQCLTGKASSLVPVLPLTVLNCCDYHVENGCEGALDTYGLSSWYNDLQG